MSETRGHAEEHIRRVQVAIRTRVLCESCRSPDVTNYGQSRKATISYYRCLSCAVTFKVFEIRIDSSFSAAEQLRGLNDG